MVRSLQKLIAGEAFTEGTEWSRERFAPNETIVRHREAGDRLYLILSGSVKVMGEASVAGSVLRSRLSVLHAGEVFGELVLFDYALRSATVATDEGCELAAVRSDALIAYCDRHPEFGYHLLKELFQTVGRRLRQSNERVTDLTLSLVGSHGPRPAG